MILLITGPQGSGKGTQSKLLAEKFGLFHMESGEMLRETAKLDKRIKNMLYKGIIVPDDETLSMIKKYIPLHNGDYKNVIFDGYPRSISQYKKLIIWLESVNLKIDFGIVINLSKEESIRRLSSRRTCQLCGRIFNMVTNPPKDANKCECGGGLTIRDDDKLETIEKRLSVYEKSTKKLIEEYRKDNILIETNGERSIEDIFKDIVDKILKRQK